MTSGPVALLLADLGVTKTHSRPYNSNDNPFSESHFKTFKYRPEFPDRFGCIQDARSFCQSFRPGLADSPGRSWRPVRSRVGGPAEGLESGFPDHSGTLRSQTPAV